MSVDILSPYRVGPPWTLSAPILPLRCPMCNRRLGDLSMTHGRMGLIRASLTIGIPAGRPSSERHAVASSSRRRARHRGWVFVSLERDRWRIWCEHKGRGVLDRTVTASTMERLYAAALAARAREVVLP